MGSVTEKLEYLLDTKDDIKDAIESKGLTVADNATFRSYADKIRAIYTNDFSSPTIKITNGVIEATSSGGTTSKPLSDFDDEFKAENIKYGVNIFGVTGALKANPVTMNIGSSSITITSLSSSRGEIKIRIPERIKSLCGLNVHYMMQSSVNHAIFFHPYKKNAISENTAKCFQTVNGTIRNNECELAVVNEDYICNVIITTNITEVIASGTAILQSATITYIPE